MWHQVAVVQELGAKRCLGFTVYLATVIVDGFIVREAQTDIWLAYLNQCPHLGLNLNWHPDQFLDHAERFLVCSMHMALFEIANGRCVHGPCLGQSLKPLAVKIENQVLWVDIDECQ